MTYFRFENGQYIEDPEGYLVGLQGIDSHGNEIRLVVHTPDMVGLQYNNVGYVYGVYISPEGIEGWLHSRDTRSAISDNNYVDERSGLTVPKEEAVDENGELNQGYDKQLHFFIQSAKGEQSLPDALYVLIINQIKQDEGLLLKDVILK